MATNDRLGRFPARGVSICQPLFPYGLLYCCNVQNGRCTMGKGKGGLNVEVLAEYKKMRENVIRNMCQYM